ncbi:hypothetical protein BDQ17DRAFT_1167888, partial [Cyathus striatus]
TTQAAPFAINIGTLGADTVAWVEGKCKCERAVLGPSGTNFCERPFNINGEERFVVKGCGGDRMWINMQQDFYGNCGRFEERDDCNVRAEYHC